MTWKKLWYAVCRIDSNSSALLDADPRTWLQFWNPTCFNNVTTINFQNNRAYKNSSILEITKETNCNSNFPISSISNSYSYTFTCLLFLIWRRSSNEALGNEFILLLAGLLRLGLLEKLSSASSTASGGGEFSHVFPIALPFLLLCIYSACEQRCSGWLRESNARGKSL